MSSKITFDVEAILSNLQETPSVIIVDARLCCNRKHSDLVSLMRRFLKHGYRKLEEGDLQVGTVLLVLSFFRDMFEEGKPNGIHIVRVRITEIRTPEEMVERRKRLAKKDPEMAAALAPFELPKENIYTLVLDGESVSGEVDQRFGQLSQSILLRGTVRGTVRGFLVKSGKSE
ncbi:MAG: hypothetical protein FJ044_02440 [Candidatus Cloacimonetes bacterium]|nr:hypothetical protein [Candidatus Cloacimonadota bacterium]